MRVLGIDPGLKRVGLSLSDESGELASPHRTLLRTDDAQLVKALCEEARAFEVGTIVLGLPLRMNGLEGPEAKRARIFGRKLEQELGIKVVLWDERLTTMAAERELRGVGKRGEKKKALLDQAAATLLLQSYLDAQRFA
jgi:putative Holliday junction resolvase